MLQVWRSGPLIVMRGRLEHNATHKHLAHQLIFTAPSTAPATLLTPNQTTLSAEALFIRGGSAHALRLPEAGGLIALIEPQSHLAHDLLRRYPTQSVAALEPLSAAPSMDALNDWLTQQALSTCTATHTDARIARVLDWIDASEQTGKLHELNLNAALELTRYSSSRFLHLFTEHVGSPWRAYLVWRRAILAMSLCATDKTLTEIAALAGYADSAHLTRQIKGMFGYSPSQIRQFSQFIQGPS